VAEDRLLERLKTELDRDFTPVVPLAGSWKRALWLWPAALMLIAAAIAGFGLRVDHARFGTMGLWGLGIVQFAGGYLVLAASLRLTIPGRGLAALPLSVLGIAAACTHFAASEMSLLISPNGVGAGQDWRFGLICLAIIMIFAAIPFLLGVRLVRAGLPIQVRSVGLLMGLGSGLTAEAAWRFHCPISTWDHVLPFHTGAILAVLLIGLLFSNLLRHDGSR
jgi:hypothetical protein